MSIIHRKCVQTLGPMSRSIFRDIFHAGLDFTKNIRHLMIDKIFSVIDKRNALQVNNFQTTLNIVRLFLNKTWCTYTNLINNYKVTVSMILFDAFFATHSQKLPFFSTHAFFLSSIYFFSNQSRLDTSGYPLYPKHFLFIN